MESCWYLLLCVVVLSGAWAVSRLIAREQARDRSYGSGNESEPPGGLAGGAM